MHVGDVSDVSGEVLIAGGDIVQNIQTIFERALTPGEIVEKELQLELNELARGVREYLQRLKDQVAAADSPTPYKGLEAYTFAESHIFFGRERAARDLYRAMRQSALTVLQAESGAGKTSLLQAGIVSRVLAAQHLAVPVRAQFDNPSTSIKRVFLPNEELTPKLSRASLVEFLRRVTQVIGHQTTLYIILDQFEEFFSRSTSEQDRQEFITELAACLDDKTLNVRWVISITTNAFGQLSRLQPYVQNPFANVQSLLLFDRKEAAEVIATPALQHQLSFEEGLLQQLLDDLDIYHNEAIAPTQIQLVCAALYEDLGEKGSVFTHELYRQQGGAQGILHDYLARVLDHNLPPEERPVAYKVLEALVTSEKKRVLRVKEELETALLSKGIPSTLLESTLDHLVRHRLLRCLGDHPLQLQYEIVHDYLLGEIEINEGVRKSKEAEELLEQGARNWNRQELLLAPDAMKIIESRAATLTISSAAATLMFLSALEYNRPAGRWLEMISFEDQKGLTDSLLAQKRSRKNQEGLWYLRRHLSNSEMVEVALARSGRVIWLLLRMTILIFLIAVAVFIIGRVVIGETQAVVPWTRASLSSQCLHSSPAAELLVAIDAANGSRVAAYDPRTHRLCETANTGASWQFIGENLPPDLDINAIAFHGSIYLATDQGIYHQDAEENWQALLSPREDRSAFQKIAASSEPGKVYAATELGRVYLYDVSTDEPAPVALDGLTGDITDLTINYAYFAISTSDGVWYRQLDSELAWTKSNFLSDENPGFVSIELLYPVRSWRYLSYESQDDDRFFAVTEKGELYSGTLTEKQSLRKVLETPARISSLAVNGLSKFSASPDGLYCQQTWYLIQSEWWLRFTNTKPCQ